MHLGIALGLRGVLVKHGVLNLPPERQSTRLLLLDFALFVGAGLGVASFHAVFLGFPWFSGLEIMIGFAAVGVFAALDMSLAWEHHVIGTAMCTEQSAQAPGSFFPQTRRFALLASGVIIAVTAILLLLLARDISWLQEQLDSSLTMTVMLRAVIWEVLFVMGVLLVLTLTLVFSYARNLKLLFTNQTTVLERVSQGLLDRKVPVVTNDEFAVIAGYTNCMIDRLVERERMAQGLALARQIQSRLLPSSSPLLAGVQVYGQCVFCDETGGDFYDYCLREGEDGPEVVVVVGDVTGHGVGSALLMTSARAYLKTLLSQGLSLTNVMDRGNTLICGDVGSSGHFVTLFVFSYTPRTRQARWVGAGHGPGFFCSAVDGSVRRLRGQDIPWGVQAQWTYTEFVESLDPGIVLLCTDGIWEAADAQEHMFGHDQIAQVLNENAHACPAEIATALLSAVEAFTGPGRIEDDRSVVVTRVGGAGQVRP